MNDGKGKKQKYYDQAEQMYVDRCATITEIAATLPVSEVSLREWRDWGGWDAQRDKKRDQAKTLSDDMLSIVSGKIKSLAAKHADDLNTADLDALAKCNKILGDIGDPSQRLRVAVETIYDLAQFVSTQDRELAPRLAGIIDAYLEKIRRENPNE